MLISEFTIRNYKGFRDTGPITLSSGFNVAVGQNNAGKTALIEALRLELANKPHRSLATVPSRLTPL